MKMSITGIAYLAAIALAGVAVYFTVKGGKAAVSSALDAVNPLNSKNVFATGANNLYQAVTGDKVNTIGTAAADLVDRWTTNSGAIATAPSVPKSNTNFPAPDFQSVGGEQGFIL